MKISVTRTGYDPALGRNHPTNRDATLEAHVADIRKQFESGLGGDPTGAFRYRWECSCGQHGEWREGTKASGDHAKTARSARNGGARHVAAMERGR